MSAVGTGEIGATPVDVVVIVFPLSFAAALSAAAISASGSTSASMMRSGDFDRSWLRRRRTVSRFASTSSLPADLVVNQVQGATVAAEHLKKKLGKDKT